MRKKLFIIFIIFALLCFSFVFASNFDKGAKKSNLLMVSSYEIPIGKDFDLSIDLSNVPFNDFKIELASNVDLDDPLIDDENVDTNIDDSDNLVITVNNNNLNELKLNYSLPKDVAVGDSIQFIVTITSIESSSDETPVTLDDSITLTVIEDKENKNADVEDSKNGKDSFERDSDDVNEMSTVDSKLDESSIPSLNNGSAKSESFDVSLNTSSKNSSDSIKTSSQNMQSSQSVVSSSKSASSDSQQVSYLGSSNNYLSALSVDGFEFSSSFFKTNSTYFVVVPANTDSLTINASAEDSSSKISVYGENDLSSEIDKILVSVTAENGNVRVYRIYVKKN